MKQLLSLLFCCILLAMFCVGASAEVDVESYVTPDREGIIEYDIPADYRLPALNMDGKISEEFQVWTDAVLAGLPGTLDSYMDRLEPEEIHLDYKCSVSDDILTVTMSLNGHSFDSWPDAAESFTIDLLTGEQLTLDGFAARYGTWEQLEDFMVKFLLERVLNGETQRFSDPTALARVQGQLLSPENLKQSTITLNACDELFPIVICVPYYYRIDYLLGEITESDTPCGIMYVRARTVEEIFGD